MMIVCLLELLRAVFDQISLIYSNYWVIGGLSYVDPCLKRTGFGSEFQYKTANISHNVAYIPKTVF